MDLLSQCLKKQLLVLFLVLLGCFAVFGGLLATIVSLDNNTGTPTSYILLLFGGIILFAFLLTLPILLIQKSKSKKKLSVLSATELEELNHMYHSKRSICNCYLLDQHLVSMRSLIWTIIPYDNIRSIKRECTVYKSYGISVNKQYSIIIATKQGKPATFNIFVKKKVLEEQYPEFAGRISEMNSEVYEAGNMGKYR